MEGNSNQFHSNCSTGLKAMKHGRGMIPALLFQVQASRLQSLKNALLKKVQGAPLQFKRQTYCMFNILKHKQYWERYQWLDLNNSLLGVLLQLRKKKVPFFADVRQNFHYFLVWDDLSSVFSDVSTKTSDTVVYLKTTQEDWQIQIGFIAGKLPP